MSEDEVEEYRIKRQITVEGKDLPKPVKEFSDIGFPGKEFGILFRKLKKHPMGGRQSSVESYFQQHPRFSSSSGTWKQHYPSQSNYGGTSQPNHGYAPQLPAYQPPQTAYAYPPAAQSQPPQPAYAYPPAAQSTGE